MSLRSLLIKLLMKASTISTDKLTGTLSLMKGAECITNKHTFDFIVGIKRVKGNVCSLTEGGYILPRSVTNHVTVKFEVPISITLNDVIPIYENKTHIGNFYNLHI